MIDMSKYDRIVITADQLDEIVALCEITQPEFQKIKLPLEEALLIVKGLPEEGKESVHHFKLLDPHKKIMHHTIYMDGIMRGDVETEIAESGVLSARLNADYEFDGESLGYYVSVGFFSVMNYISEHEEERIEVKRTKIKTKQGKGSKQKIRKVITLRKKIFVYDKPGEKRLFNRITDTWGVRGHWRLYKTGKRIWVKPHVKGHGEKEAKEYKLG